MENDLSNPLMKIVSPYQKLQFSYLFFDIFNNFCNQNLSLYGKLKKFTPIMKECSNWSMISCAMFQCNNKDRLPEIVYRYIFKKAREKYVKIL